MRVTLNLLALFCVLNCYSQKNVDTIFGNPKSVKEKIVFLGKSVPKKLTEYHSTIFRDNSRNKKGYLETFFRDIGLSYVNCKMFYNEKGLLEEEFWYDFSNKLESTLYYSYDKNENLIEEKEVFLGGEFLLMKNHYNISNKVIAVSSYSSTEPNEFDHWYYIRDINNNIIETKMIDEDGEEYSIVNDLNEQQKIIKKYREFLVNWRLPKDVQLKFKEKELNMYEYDYDKNGNKILQLYYSESPNRIYSKNVWRFNSQNKIVELKLYYNMRDTTKYKMFRYNYNDKGLRIYEEETSSKDSTFKSIKRFYNQEDYITKTIVFENEKIEVLNFKYKFDKKGNWTKIIKTVNSEPLYIWTRKIKYY